MLIYIKKFDKRQFLGPLILEPDSSDTVHSLKTKISAKDGIPVEAQNLTYRKQQLDDNRKLSSYDIRYRSTLSLTTVPLGCVQVMVRASDSSAIKLDIVATDTISTVKAKIQARSGIHPDHQHLFFEGTELLDYNTLAYYDIWHDPIIRLIPCPAGYLLVSVEMLSGQSFPVVIKLSDTVNSLKTKIHAEGGIPVDDQRLFGYSKLLEDGQTLSDANIYGLCTLTLKVIPRGTVSVNITANNMVNFKIDTNGENKMQIRN